MTKLDRLLAVARIVSDLQHEYDAEDLRTTGCIFMFEQYPDDRGAAERARILGAIDHRRTEAIWALGKALLEYEKEGVS